MSSGILILLKRMLVQFAYHFLILEKGHNPLYSQGFPCPSFSAAAASIISIIWQPIPLSVTLYAKLIAY